MDVDSRTRIFSPFHFMREMQELTERMQRDLLMEPLLPWRSIFSRESHRPNRRSTTSPRAISLEDLDDVFMVVSELMGVPRTVPHRHHLDTRRHHHHAHSDDRSNRRTRNNNNQTDSNAQTRVTNQNNQSNQPNARSRILNNLNLRNRHRRNVQTGRSSSDTESHFSDDVEICLICRDRFKETSDIRQLACEHFFHRECLTPWLQRSRTCPTCRAPV